MSAGDHHASTSSAAAASLISSTHRGRKRGRPSSSRGARSSPFPDFGSYMAVKNRKLRQQFDADASDAAGGIFRGVSIFVDGLTTPSNQELKDIMLKNGGRFENYFSRRTVTHIICSNLPDSKMRNLRSFSRGLPVVKPSWVVESVAANRLLNWTSYQLMDSVNEASKQLKLSAFFSQRSTLRSNNHKIEEDVNNDKKASLNFEEMHEDSPSSDQVEVHTCDGLDNESQPEDYAELDSEETGDANLSDKSEVAEMGELYSKHPTSKNITDDTQGIKSATGTKEKCSNMPHSTLTDSNFVENYFKHSRLHFIGTWRNRYRKQFSDMIERAKTIQNNSNSHHEKRKSTIMHIDMDCFFVSVVIRNSPGLVDKPVAVCHSNNPKGTAEISSANYPARKYGIKAGMFVRDAKLRCPDLLIFPYNFEAYEEVADQFYQILHKHCNKVQALSCDEAFLDMTECLTDDPEQAARMIRREISESTGCTASAGISENLLLARIATRLAKPNGQYFIPSEKVDEFLNNLSIKELPGIGHTVADKLKSKGVENCSQLRMSPKEVLCKDFGKKTGELLWNYCRGIDHSVVEAVQETKSVGAEVNWGVRFHDINDADNFLIKLCKEVSLRLQECGVQGRTITLKVKKRRKGAGEPVKFMGCGDCETMSRSVTMAGFTDDVCTLQRIAKQIFSSFHVDVKEVRGVGLKLSKLEHVAASRKGAEGNALKLWLNMPAERINCHSAAKICAGTSGGSDCQLQGYNRSHSLDRSCDPSRIHQISGRPTGNSVLELPPLCSLDLEVVKNLPAEIVSEIDSLYNGGLKSLLNADEHIEGTDVLISHKRKSEQSYNALIPFVKAEVLEQPGAISLNPIVCVEDKGKHSINDGTLSTFNGRQLKMTNAGSNELIVGGEKESNAEAGGTSSAEIEEIRAVDRPHRDPSVQASSLVIPSSLNIVNKTSLLASVPEELPDGIRADVCGQLLQQRTNCGIANVPAYFACKLPDMGDRKNIQLKSPLAQNPLEWVENFRTSCSLLLNITAEVFEKVTSGGLLSSVFLSKSACIVASSPEPNTEERAAAMSSLSYLLNLYIHLKVEFDIEELYGCFRLLKRFSQASPFFLELHNTMLPILQASVNEHYGGSLQF